MQAVGLFFGHLFSADSQTVNQIKQDVKDLRTGSEIFKNENKPPNGNP
jgi:hypothetical protein